MMTYTHRELIAISLHRDEFIARFNEKALCLLALCTIFSAHSASSHVVIIVIIIITTSKCVLSVFARA